MNLPPRYIAQTFRLGSAAFASGAIGYYLLALFLRDERSTFVFGSAYRMIEFHNAHPLQFIGVVAIAFGTVAPFFQPSFLRHRGWRRHGIYALLLAATLLLAMPWGGLLWCHHWCFNDLASSGESWSTLFSRRMGECIADSFLQGPLILLLSFPYNVLGWFVGLGLLRWLTPAVRSDGNPAP